jgi:hypothetical protein
LLGGRGAHRRRRASAGSLEIAEDICGALSGTPRIANSDGEAFPLLAEPEFATVIGMAFTRIVRRWRSRCSRSKGWASRLKALFARAIFGFEPARNDKARTTKVEGPWRLNDATKFRE